MKQLLPLICLMLCIAFSTKAQNCKVLLPSIAGSYEGGCKNDKANGLGKAVGMDSYDGNFKNGLPEGMGKYIWKEGNWYEGNFKFGQRSGEGTLHSPSVTNSDSLIAGFWLKDAYVGIYEYPFKVISKTFMVNTVAFAFESVGEPSQIIINLSSVKGGSEDVHGTIPKPELIAIDVTNGSYMNKKEVNTMKKINTYFLTNVLYPFYATLRIGEEEVVIDIKKSGTWKIDVVLR